MSIRSIDEIVKLSHSMKNPEKIAYKQLVKQLDPQIRERAKRYGSFVFRTPLMLWGSPVFIQSKVEKKLIKHYRRLGFDCYRKRDGDIIIRWRDDPDSNDESGVSSESSSDEEPMVDNSQSIGMPSRKEDSDSDSDNENNTMNVVVETGKK